MSNTIYSRFYCYAFYQQLLQYNIYNIIYVASVTVNFIALSTVCPVSSPVHQINKQILCSIKQQGETQLNMDGKMPFGSCVLSRQKPSAPKPKIPCYSILCRKVLVFAVPSRPVPSFVRHDTKRTNNVPRLLSTGGRHIYNYTRHLLIDLQWPVLLVSVVVALEPTLSLA
jgi:hypothetical protein